MAITINQSPPNIAPVYNPMVYVISSNNIANNKFRYIFQIITGSTTITVRQSPNPDGYGVLDISRLIEDFVSYDFSSATLFQINSGSFVKYDIKFGEEYSSSPTTDPTDHLDLNSKLGYYGFNASLEYLEWLQFDVTKYQLSSSTKKFLTNSSRLQYIGIEQQAYLYWIYVNLTGTGNKKMIVKTYDSFGGLMATHTESNSFSPPNIIQFFERFAVGTAALSDIGVSFSGVDYYTVQMTDNSNVASSELFTYKLTDLCTKYKVYRLHFMNKLGGFDAFNFTLRDTVNTDIIRTTFEKTIGNFVAPDYLYKAIDRGTVQDNTELKDTIIINSNWITNTEAVWLKELFTSPLVYLEDVTLNPSGTFVPIAITDTKYQTKKSVPGEKLFNIIVNFSFAVQNNRQRF